MAGQYSVVIDGRPVVVPAGTTGRAPDGPATTGSAVLAYAALAQVRAAVPHFLALSAASFIYIAAADLIPGLHRPEARRRATLQVVLTSSWPTSLRTTPALWLREQGILIKPLGDARLGRSYMRITTARPDDNARFVAALRALP